MIVAFPNISAPLAYEVGDVNEKMTQLWWENPHRQLSFSEAREKLAPFSAATAMGGDALKMLHSDLSR